MSTVIKLGGSLSQSSGLHFSLQAIERQYRQDGVVIVPGGGRFADAVRCAYQDWGLHERAAHSMALLAMQQMAILINALQPDWRLGYGVEPCRHALGPGRVIIWAPLVQELDEAGVPASWDITSDSLAAWLAQTLSVEQLILVKSVVPTTAHDYRKLQAEGILDAAFHRFVEPRSYTLSVLHYQQL